MGRHGGILECVKHAPIVAHLDGLLVLVSGVQKRESVRSGRQTGQKMRKVSSGLSFLESIENSTLMVAGNCESGVGIYLEKRKECMPVIAFVVTMCARNAYDPFMTISSA
jgi:hypothetical protein